jgi:hypothetical protein
VTFQRSSTTVAERDIPIEPGDATVVLFSAETPDDSMAGDWEFWTLFDGSRSVTGRCRAGQDPGERFRRMEGDTEYDDAWEIAKAAIGIRSATRKAVVGWLNSHP